MESPELADYEAVVYDLDGTLVRLAVDWEAAGESARQALRQAGHDPDAFSLWDCLAYASETGGAARETFEGAVGPHEHAGARESARLAHADDLPLSVPTGVCSLNCERACHLALDQHGLADHVDAVVGRDTVGTYKPDPEPLRATFERLGVAPADGLFVGDSERDEVTAERAGVDFRWVE